MSNVINREQKMRDIFETAQKMKNGTMTPAKVYNSIDEFANNLKSEWSPLWKVIIANDTDDDFIRNVNAEAGKELVDHFKEVSEVFDSLNGSVMCTSAIYDIKSYDVQNKKLSIHYHIDNNEEVIRITSFDLS